MNVLPPGQAPYRDPYAQPGGSGAGMGGPGMYNPSPAYNPTLATNPPAPMYGAGGSTAYDEKLYFHVKKLLTLRVILKIVEILLSFIYAVCISVLFPCINPMGGFCMFTGWTIFGIAIFLFLVHTFGVDPIMPGPWFLIELILMIVILVFLLVAEILTIIGAALWPWASIIVACIFGGLLFLVCIASIVVPFFVRDEDTQERQTFSGLFKSGGGGGSAYPSGSARPVTGIGLGLPPPPETHKQDSLGGYGGGGYGNNNSGGPNQNTGPGSAYTTSTY